MIDAVCADGARGIEAQNILRCVHEVWRSSQPSSPGRKARFPPGSEGRCRRLDWCRFRTRPGRQSPGHAESSTPDQRRGESRKLFGVSRLLFQPALAAEITGIGLSAASAAAAGGRLRRIAGHHECGPAGSGEIDVRGLIRLRVQILIEFVAQTRVQLQTLRDLPAILDVEMGPAGVGILGSFADSNLRLRRDSPAGNRPAAFPLYAPL